MRIILNKEKRSFTFLILVKFIKKSQNKLAIFLRILYDIISEKSNISWRYKMKKTIAIILIVLCLLSINNVFATEVNTLEKQNKEEISGIKNKMEEKKEEYTEKYGSEAYWFAGYVLEEIVQPYSIPLCFVGIAVGLVFQYVMGTRRLDYKHRGFSAVIVFVTILIICQLLPFIYALVVVGWRG